MSLEQNVQVRSIGERKLKGRALYGALSGQICERWFVLFEGKDFRKFEPLRGGFDSPQNVRFAYATPPTAERIDQALLDNSDISGGRLRVEWVSDGDLSNSIFGNVGLFKHHGFDQWFLHVYTGIDRRFVSGGGLQGAIAIREEVDGADFSRTRTVAQADVDWLQPLGKGYALNLTYNHQSHWNESGGARFQFHRGNSAFEFVFPEIWSGGLGVDYDTEDRRDEVRRWFPFTWIRYRASSGAIVELMAGARRGGLKCTAGACRFFPGFPVSS